MFSCDRCARLFNGLQRVIRRNSDGQIVIDTRICKPCAFLTGLFSAVLPEIVEREIFEEEAVPEWNMPSAQVVEVTELD